MSGKGYVAASVGPAGDIVEEEGGDTTIEEWYTAFREQVVALAEGGADAICIETMSSPSEAVQAIKAVKENTNLPVICTFTFEQGLKRFRTMTDTRPERAAREAVAAGADAIGANCGYGIANMIEITRQMQAAAPGKPFQIHTNAGAPEGEYGNTGFKAAIEYMPFRVSELIEAGANIVAGCCGTSPGHLATIAKAVCQRG